MLNAPSEARSRREKRSPKGSMNSLIEIENDRFHDHCGVCGVFGHPEAAKLAYLGLYALQHRGQESAGNRLGDSGELDIGKTAGQVGAMFWSERPRRVPRASAVMPQPTALATAA